MNLSHASRACFCKSTYCRLPPLFCYFVHDSIFLQCLPLMCMELYAFRTWTECRYFSSRSILENRHRGVCSELHFQHSHQPHFTISYANLFLAFYARHSHMLSPKVLDLVELLYLYCFLLRTINEE